MCVCSLIQPDHITALFHAARNESRIWSCARLSKVPKPELHWSEMLTIASAIASSTAGAHARLPKAL